MFARRTDLALDKDAMGRFLPWLIAFMVYLAIMAFAGLLVLNETADRWDKGVGNTLTVQIEPAARKEDDTKRLSAALLLLRRTEGVARADALPEADVMNLLEPWLGASSGMAGLPMPRLIDVTLQDGATVTAEDLRQRLDGAVPGVTIDDHRVWLDRLISLISTIQLTGLAVIAMILSATVGTVIFTTRTGLAIHQEAIEVLHLIGAHDSYIAKQFAGRAMALGLKGGVLGLVLAVPTLLGIGYLSRQMEEGLLPAFSLSPVQWGMLTTLPLIVALIAMLTARVTVLKNLSKML